jgi:hypothetical protein
MNKIAPVKKQNREKISDRVAQLSSESDLETKGFLISYCYYKNKECEVNDLQKVPAQKTLKKLITIGQSLSLEHLKEQNVRIENVINSNSYRKLYHGVPPDVDILETCISKAGRGLVKSFV